MSFPEGIVFLDWANGVLIADEGNNRVRISDLRFQSHPTYIYLIVLELLILRFFSFRLTFTQQMENSGTISSSNATALFREGLQVFIKIKILILLISLRYNNIATLTYNFFTLKP